MQKKMIDFFTTKPGKRIRDLLMFLALSGISYTWIKDMVLAVIISSCISIYAADFFYGREQSRRKDLHRQLIGFLEHMVIMLRAGKTIRHIFLHSWSRFPAPLGAYLKEVNQLLEIDPDLDNALTLFEEKSKSREVLLLTAGIRINSRIGGDIIILLESMTASLRKSLRAASRMENLTLQSRMSANIISFFPVASLLFLSMFCGTSVIDFFSTKAGTILLVTGGILEIAGILIMKKILIPGDEGKELPYVLDLLRISTLSGQNIYNSFKMLTEKYKGGICRCLEGFIRDVDLGAGKEYAYKNLCSSSRSKQFREFIDILMLADIYGSPVSGILSSRSFQISNENWDDAERRSKKTGLLTLVPLVFLILPAFIILVGGPLIFSLVSGILF